MRKHLKYLKHYIKLVLGKQDPLWPLFVFENKIRPDTWENREQILALAEDCLAKKDEHESPELYEKSDDPLVRQGYELKQKTEKHFKNLLLGKNNARLLIHVPDPSVSPAGFSLFINFAESFEFIGIPTKILALDDSIEQTLDEFKPNVFITSDYSTYLEKIDWYAVAHYRKTHTLKVGLTASPENTEIALEKRLDWAMEHNIDFYYNFRDPDFVHTQEEYKPFFYKGYKILFLPFGVNILHYYPIPNITKDIDYVFLASVNRTKGLRYKDYVLPIASKHAGFIDGPGWQQVKDFHFNRDRDRYIYARSKIGLNIHLEEQVVAANEVNERTYMLAACGVPQITDNAKILPKLFSKKALFVAKNPKEYKTYFDIITKNPEIGVERALIAQREVFERHTTFHRAQSFIEQLAMQGLIH